MSVDVERKMKEVAIAPGGGHWVQLLRLAPAFGGCDVTYATVHGGCRSQTGDAGFAVIPDASRWNPCSLVRAAIHVLLLLWKTRFDVVVIHR